MLVLLARYLYSNGKGGGVVELVEADLEQQLARARGIPGAEALLDRLTRQPVLFERELADFAAQLDNLERTASVEHRAPRVARLAR